jgi:putative protein-disulfide isomerase
MNTLDAQKDSLIYVGDPMCSWCYGFGPELEKVLDQFPDLELKIITGGLRADGQERMVDLKEFLKGHWEEISEITGLPFSYAILDNEDLYYNTEPACRAVVTFRHLNPAKSLEYFRLLQNAFYHENKNPVATETFAVLAEKLGVEKTKFFETFQSKEMMLQTRQDFSTAQSLGIRGFPSLLLKKGNQIYLLSNGYRSADAIQDKIREIAGK